MVVLGKSWDEWDELERNEMAWDGGGRQGKTNMDGDAACFFAA